MEKIENEINELEAWKLMMDSMVKFIEASTKVMNTFTEKANSRFKLPIISSCEMQSMISPALSALNYHTKRFKYYRPGSAPERGEPENTSDSDYEYTRKGRRTKKSPVSHPFKDQANKTLFESIEKREEILEGNDGNDGNIDSISLLEEEIKLVSEGETHAVPEHLPINKEIDYPCCPVGDIQKQTQSELKGDQKISAESMTHLITLKLEQAQKEIDDLKNEFMKMQAAKNVKVSTLYRDYDKTCNSSNSTRVKYGDDNTENMVSSRKPTCPSRSLMSPTETFRQTCSPKWQHQPTVMQRRGIPLRIRPRRITTNEMVYLRNNMQQRRRVQSTTGYEQMPVEMDSSNYQAYQKQIYPIYTRTEIPGTEPFINQQRAAIGPGYTTYQTGQSVYHACEGTPDHFRHRKSQNYFSMSDEASGEDYLCDSEFF